MVIGFVYVIARFGQRDVSSADLRVNPHGSCDQLIWDPMGLAKLCTCVQVAAHSRFNWH